MSFDFPFKKGSGIPLLTANLSPQCLSLLHAMVGTAPSPPRCGAPQDTSLEAKRVCAGRGEPRLLVRSAPQWHRRELAGRPTSTWVRLALDAQARGGVIPPSHPLPRVRPQGDK